jgi:hypothetical protein
LFEGWDPAAGSGGHWTGRSLGSIGKEPGRLEAAPAIGSLAAVGGAGSWLRVSGSVDDFESDGVDGAALQP